MGEPVADRLAMIRGMAPELTIARFAFVTVPEPVPARLQSAALAMFREAEGVSLIVPAALASEAAAMRMIRLNVHSSLDGVGLTAAVSSALAEAGIAANVVAAFHHDHIFVPEARADAALAVLHSLSRHAS